MKRLLFLILIIFILPIYIINKDFYIEIKQKIHGFNSNNIVYVRVLKNDNSIERIELEDYLIGVVSSEVPVYFNEEALKAQAVASRTYALKQIYNNKDNLYDLTDSTLSQVYSSNDRLKEKWGSDYENNYNKIKKAINDTKGEYISYNDEPIYAFFFSTSNGYTEDNVNVFGEDLPYLKPVDSSFDEEETDSFIFTKEFSKEDFYYLLGISYENKLVLDNIIKSDTNRVLYIDINNITFKGRDFQKKLSLRSNDFEIEERGESVLITTKGFGHGVGLSQYGSNALAKRNKNYIEILKYYYQGTEIKKL